MHPAISRFVARARIADLHGQARRAALADTAEAETFGGLDPDTIAAAHRWLY